MRELLESTSGPGVGCGPDLGRAENLRHDEQFFR